jgi:hypothetical protein
MSGRFLNALTSTLDKEILFFGNGNHDIPQIKIFENQSRRTGIKMKKIFVIIFILGILPTLMASGGKVVYIPDNVEVEENVFKAATIGNLSEIEIYRCCPINLIDDFIYLLDYDSSRIVKLSQQGKFVSQFGKKGGGPGEFLGLSGISRLKENIAVIARNKVVICDKDLKFLREIKLKQIFQNFISANNNMIYFYSNPSYSNYYFSVYTEDFKPFKKFGIKNPNAKEKKSTYKNYKPSRDIVRRALYVPEENGIWVSFWNRYDLRYYKDEKVVVDVKSKRQIFATSEEEFSGRKVKTYMDYSLLIAKHKNQLYYCYKLGDNRFCDVFNLSENFRLHRRLKFPYRYKQIVLSNGLIFYGLRYEPESKDVLLDKIQIF